MLKFTEVNADIGMQRMISEKKDCIGKTSASRPGLLDSNREQMVAMGS